MTTPTKDAQAALAILDDHPFLGMPAPGTWIKLGVREARQIQAALRALIEPVQGDAKLLQNSDREALTRSVGMLLAENDDMEAMDDDAFEIVRDSLVKGLMELYPAGFRRQVSHPEPEEWEYAVDDVGMHPGGDYWRQRGEKRPIDLERTMEVPGRLRRWYGVSAIYRRRPAGPWLPVPEEENK